MFFANGKSVYTFTLKKKERKETIMKIMKFCQNCGKYWYSVIQAENDLNVQMNLESFL